MKVVVQRSNSSSVSVDNKVVGKIDNGLVLLVGFTDESDKNEIDYMVNKIVNLRIFDDEAGIMNKSILDVGGAILSISQFTLYADTKKSGNRPSFTEAAKPEYANELYEYFIKKCTENNINVQKGEFGADMKVELLNDGPVTIMLEK